MVSSSFSKSEDPQFVFSDCVSQGDCYSLKLVSFFWVDSMEVLVLRFSNELDTRNSLRTADLSVKICLYNDPLEFDITGLLLDL